MKFWYDFLPENLQKIIYNSVKTSDVRYIITCNIKRHQVNMTMELKDYISFYNGYSIVFISNSNLEKFDTVLKTAINRYLMLPQNLN